MHLYAYPHDAKRVILNHVKDVHTASVAEHTSGSKSMGHIKIA